MTEPENQPQVLSYKAPEQRVPPDPATFWRFCSVGAFLAGGALFLSWSDLVHSHHKIFGLFFAYVIAFPLLLLLIACFQTLVFLKSPSEKRSSLSFLAIIFYGALLLCITAPRNTCRCIPAQVQKAIADLNSISCAVEAFHFDCDRYPTNEEGIAALLIASAGIPGWEGPYIQLQTDPWGNGYIYKFPGLYHPESFDILSAGPDGIPNTEDDIHN